MKESKSMMRREVAFMKKKGAPKSMIRHEEKEAGMKKGTRKFFGGGGMPPLPSDRYSNYTGKTTNMNQAAVNRGMQGLGTVAGIGAALSKNPFVKAGKIASIAGPAAKSIYDQFTGPEETSQRSPEPETPPVGNRKGGQIKSKGGFRRQADGVAHKGKTKGHVVKMREGGSVGSFRRDADGIASKGKTRGKIVKMRYGGEC